MCWTKYSKIMVLTASICIMILSACAFGDSDADSDAEDYFYEQEEYPDAYDDQDNPEDNDQEAVEDESSQMGKATQDALQELYYTYEDIKRKAANDPLRQSEVTPHKENGLDVCSITMNDHTMRYTLDVMGEPDEDGLYPLYIALHGGGGGDAGTNDEQWMQMRNYYRDNVEDGIYVATRGMEDVWNLHFLDYSYAMYDRLIEDMIYLKNADPNRVYLLGFSAGGDGVYAIAPRMADRFAAVNMSSGHPNGVSLLNVSNLPFEIQVGIRDFYTEEAIRSIRGAEFEKTLNDYREQFGCEYPHRVLVHVPDGHNYNDYLNENYDSNAVLSDPQQFAERAVAEDWVDRFLDLYDSMGYGRDVMDMSYNSPPDFEDRLTDLVTNDLNMKVDRDGNTNAVEYVNGFTRKPAPHAFVWDLSTRAPKRSVNSFYWLKADQSVNEGVVYAVYDEESNTVYIEYIDEPNGNITILANPLMMDFDRPLTVVTEKGQRTVDLTVDKNITVESIHETADPYLSWVCEIPVD